MVDQPQILTSVGSSALGKGGWGVGWQWVNTCLGYSPYVAYSPSLQWHIELMFGRRSIPVSINRQDQWNMRKTYVQHWLDLCLLTSHPPTLCFAGRMGGEWIFIKTVWCYAQVSLQVHVQNSQETSGCDRSIVQEVCRSSYWICMCWLKLSLTSGSEGEFVKCSKFITSDLLC